MSSDELHIYTLYWNPSDYPGKYVVRRTVIAHGESRVDSEPLCVSSLLHDIHHHLPPGLVYVPRSHSDDEVIVGIFL